MKATVYCLEDHKMEIREAVSVSFPDAEVKFAAYEDLTVGGELLAVDHELVHLLKKDETAGYPSVYVYFKRRLFAVSRELCIRDSTGDSGSVYFGKTGEDHGHVFIQRLVDQTCVS